jgi:hypothetical protein
MMRMTTSFGATTRQQARYYGELYQSGLMGSELEYWDAVAQQLLSRLDADQFAPAAVAAHDQLLVAVGHMEPALAEEHKATCPLSG